MKRNALPLDYYTAVLIELVFLEEILWIVLGDVKHCTHSMGD